MYVCMYVCRQALSLFYLRSQGGMCPTGRVLALVKQVLHPSKVEWVGKDRTTGIDVVWAAYEGTAVVGGDAHLCR